MRNVSFTRDGDGHRNYTVDWHLRVNDPEDGPAVILQNWLLPAVGTPYSIDNDTDLWAFCTPALNIAKHPDTKEGDPIIDWIVTQQWTTNPSWRCQTFPIENPLLEPYQLSGDFIHEQYEPTVDKDGDPMLHPNFQPIRGPLIEQKRSRPSMTITFNSATLPLSTYVLLLNHVNDTPLWGLPPRCIKFADAKWERLLYGTCYYYFRTSYTFEFDLETFDKPVPATGTVVLREGGDPTNPEDFVLADPNDENREVLLDQFGRPISKAEDQYISRPKVAKQGNLLLLGIPTTLN